MITEEAIRTEKNNTPVGLASWCWGANMDYAQYLELAKTAGIEALNSQGFHYVHNWWDEQWDEIAKAKVQ